MLFGSLLFLNIMYLVLASLLIKMFGLTPRKTLKYLPYLLPLRGKIEFTEFTPKKRDFGSIAVTFLWDPPPLRAFFCQGRYHTK